MGYLSQILMAIGVLALAEARLTTGWRVPALALAPCLLPHVLTAWARREYFRGRFRSSATLARVQALTPVLGFLVVVTCFGWLDSVEAWVGRPVTILGWPHPAILLALAPYVLYQVLTIDATARLADTRPSVQRSLRSLQLRIFAFGLTPLLLYVGASSAIGFSDVLRAYVEEVAVWNAVFAVLLLAGFASLLPSILRNTWETIPLPQGAERAVLAEVARRADFACKEILLWKTGHSIANAAIVGLTRRHKVVLLSDSLLSQLSLRELAAVFAHEVGHAVRRHVSIFLVWAAAFFIGADLIAQRFLPQGEWMATAVVLATLAVWLLFFGYLSRRFELEADLFSLELLGDHQAIVGALEKVGGRLRDVASWRHFSPARRVEFIERAASDPGAGRQLRRRLRVVTVVGLCAFAASAALELIAMLSSLPTDLAYADLRLGRYGAARARLEAVAEPELAALIDHAERIGEGAGDVERLETAAREELRSGDGKAALLSLELASLRGRLDAHRAALAVQSALAGEPGEARERIETDVAPAWRADLRAWLDAFEPRSAQ